jgi:hypothetical protein
MNEEPMRTAESHDPPKVSSSLQAILHRGAGGMETISVPLPLPDVVVRSQEVPARAGASDHSMYEDQFFRRMRSSDSVVRYYEHAHSSPADADSGSAASDLPRVCNACRGTSACYFVKTCALHAPLTAETEALCAACYASAAR